MRHFACLCLLLLSLPLAAQGQRGPVLSNDLRIALRRGLPAGARLHLIAEGEAAALRRFCAARGGHVKYAVGPRSALIVPAGALPDLLAEPSLRSVFYEPAPVRPLADSLYINNRIDSVRLGLGPLPQGYDGQGVIIGLIDLGIDWRHPDFQGPDGQTRIRYLWDQNTASTNLPDSYGYGTLWTASDIEAGLPTHDYNAFDGHGSLASGLAAGSGQAADTLPGVAPAADIIHVSVSLDNFAAGFADAVHFILAQAEALGRPCAINSSVGSYFGPHDASDAPTQMIEAMLAAQPGRFMAQAAGNAGASLIHFAHAPAGDTVFTWFRSFDLALPDTLFRYGRIDFWGEADSLAQLRFAVGVMKNNTLALRAETPFVHLAEDLGLLADGNAERRDTLMEGSALVGYLDWHASCLDGLCHLTLAFFPSVANDRWALRTAGTGRVDGWNNLPLIGNSPIISNNLPDAASYPAIAQYRLPDNAQSLVNGTGCSDAVLCVTAYHNRETYASLAGDTQVLPGRAGQRVSYGSLGPTRDGRQKPDLATSGIYAFAAYPLDSLAAKAEAAPQQLLFTGWHRYFEGTSAAAPIASGAAALFLQLRPQASHSDIMAAFRQNTLLDSFVLESAWGGSVPNPAWGYGKLNLYQAFANSLIYGCTDSLADNYSPLADVDDGSCQLASGSQGPGTEAGIRCQPNPSTGLFHVQTHAPLGMWQVLDVLGRPIASGQPQGPDALEIDLIGWPDGLYLLRLWQADGTYLGVQSILKQAF